ncbi:hypothetical protein ACP4OV_022789 [Aristida adscensionis]
MAPKRRREPEAAAAPPPENKKRRLRLWAAARTVLVVLFLTRGKDGGAADSLARIGRVLRAMWAKLERMEQRIHSLAHLVDGIARSSTAPRNQQRHMQEAEQEGATANTGQEERNTSIRLRFLNGMKPTVFQDDEIRSDSNAPIKIGIFDGDNMIESGPLSKVKIQISALEGNFPFDASDSWTAKVFSEHRASGRDGNGNVLVGEGTTVRLVKGQCDIGRVRFREGSCRARKGMFIVGARVFDGEAAGVRIQEAVMNPVVVQDRRNRSNEKSYPPELDDGVHRLEEVAKDGKYCERMRKERIFTVQEFLRALNKDSDNLAKVLQVRKEHKPWKRMVKHARTCRLNHELKSYRCTAKNMVVFFDCVHNLVGAQLGDCYIARDKFDSVQQALVDKLRATAYDHLDALRPDHVMTETDIFPRPLNMDVGLGSGAAPSYMSVATEKHCSGHVALHQVGGAPAVVDPRQAQIESSCAAANDDPGPSSSLPDQHGRDNYQDQRTQLPVQLQFSSAYQGNLGQPNSSVGIIENFLFEYDAMNPREYSTDSAAICVEPGLDQMEIPGQSFLQVNDTLEASTSAYINMALVPLPQQLALPVLQDQLKVARRTRCKLPCRTMVHQRHRLLLSKVFHHTSGLNAKETCPGTDYSDN